MLADLDTRLWSSAEMLGPSLADAMRQRRARGDAPPDGHEDSYALAVRVADRAFLLGFRSGMLEANVGNEYIAQVARRHPDRLVPVAGIDPMLPSWPDDIDRALALGHVAITVSPSLQGYAPAHSQAMRLWERCVERSLPVLISRIGPMPPAAMLEFERPMLWDEALRAFPTLTVVFAGVGGPFFEETLVLLAKHGRTFAHVAGIARRPLDAYRWLTAAIEAGVSHRLLFASGFPFDTPHAALERLYTLNTIVQGTSLPGIPRREIESIVRRDPFEALGIGDPIATRPMGDADALMAAARLLLSDR